MSPEYSGESTKFHPSQKQLFTPMILDQRHIHSTIASNITVIKSITRNSTAKQANNSTFNPIICLPTNHLISLPEKHCPFWTIPETCPHEEHQRLFRVFLLLAYAARFPLIDKLPVYLSPQLWVSVMCSYGIFT